VPEIRREHGPVLGCEHEIQGNSRGTPRYCEDSTELNKNSKCSKNLRVNPLLSVQVPRAPGQDILAAIDGAADNTKFRTVDELGKIRSEEDTFSESEPIYDVIEPKSEETRRKDCVNVSEKESIRDQRAYSISQEGKKKEVEYWKITTKEVAQFRPCTETFISRV